MVTAESIDADAFRASRYGRGEDEAGDYINCPMTPTSTTVSLRCVKRS